MVAINDRKAASMEQVGRNAWAILHQWAEEFKIAAEEAQPGCSCGTFAVAAAHGLHDAVNMVLGKPAEYPEDFAKLSSFIAKLNAKDLTSRSRELFIEYVKDSPNWNGAPCVGCNVGGSKEDRGNLTHLKRAGLIVIERANGQAWIYFTSKGKTFAEELGLPEARYLRMALQVHRKRDILGEPAVIYGEDEDENDTETEKTLPSDLIGLVEEIAPEEALGAGIDDNEIKLAPAGMAQEDDLVQLWAATMKGLQNA